MHFSTEHRFPAAPAAVVALLVDPEFMTSVTLPDLAEPTVVVHDAGDDARLQLRYEYVGQLDPIAKRIIGGHRMTWLQDLRIDRRSLRGRLDFTAESVPDRLHAHATVAIDATESGSRRTIAGEFTVRVPIVGGTAERRILPGVLRRIDIEADAVAAHLSAEGTRP